jgi:sulfhydrogenase subunit beta (sulfur reductase)
MGCVAIAKDRINQLLKELMLPYRVVAPVRDDRTLEFKEIQQAEQVCLTDEITYKSPKEFFFPQVEEILRFSETGEVTDEANNQFFDKETVLFGVKPCDLEAFKVLNAVFTKGSFVDIFFVKHLMNTVIIGLGCIKEKPGCFCGERRINKNYSKDCDVFFTDIGDYYLVETITGKGEELLEKHFKKYMVKVFSDADTSGGIKNELDLVDIEHKTMNSCSDSTVNDADAKKMLEVNADENILFNNFDWDRVSETCMGCGICTYICPTCHCFDFKDISHKGTATRYRCWDSCMYPKFTLHASGHNPRPSKKERFRQRVMHKYVYVKKNFGYTACTGCGRCIRSCPAGVNIRTVVKKIMEELV